MVHQTIEIIKEFNFTKSYIYVYQRLKFTKLNIKK